MANIDHAALLTLMYGTRPETSVVYASDDFSNLSDFLEDPWTFFRRGKQWYSTIPWIIPSPQTIYLEPANLSDLTTKQFVGTFLRIQPKLIKHFSPTGKDGQAMFGEDDVMSSSGVDLDKLEINKANLARAFENGAFLVEFAVGTHLLNVKYLLPTTIDEIRFSEKVTQINLIRYTPTKATIHFDVGNAMSSRPILKAMFVMDYMEDSVRLLNECYNMSRVFHEGKSKFAKRGTAVKLEEPLPSAWPKLKLRKTLPCIVITDVLGKIEAGRGNDPSEVDPDDTGLICVDVTIDEDQPGTLILKRYHTP